MSSNTRYTVILRGEHRFSLSKAQIQHDSPENNFFAISFFRDFIESKSHVVHLDQDPALFAIIVQHMSGYRILPLSPTSLPSGMTYDVAIDNLARDARFFGLDDLLRSLTLPSLLPHISSLEDTTGPVIDFEDVINGQIPSRVMYTAHGLCSTTADGSLCNVLVYGRNMRLNLAWSSFGNISEPYDTSSGALRYDLYIGIPPAQLQALKGQHEGWKLAAFKIPGSSEFLRADQSPRRDASIYIDGRRALFMNLPLWLNRLHYPPEVRVQKPRYEDIRVFDEAFPGTDLHFGFEDMVLGDDVHLWIDDAIFLIRGRFSFAQPCFRLELLHARTSTRGAILSASFPPLRPERRLNAL